MYKRQYQGKRFTETVKLTPVTDVNENGYYHASFTANTDTLVTFTYLNIAGNLSVQIGNKAVGEDTICLLYTSIVSTMLHLLRLH